MLYKYRSFNKNSIQILTNLELYCSSPEKLNDPLECRFESKLIEEEIRRKIPSNEFNIFSKSKYKDKRTGKVVSLFEAIEYFTKNSGILSLSMTENDPLMWSHYAEGHQGFCIGFSRSYFEDVIKNRWQDFSIIGGAEVEYKESPSYFNIISDFAKKIIKGDNPSREKLVEDVIISVFKTKSCKWCYEEEYRILRSTKGKIKFLPEAIKEIILGKKASSSDKEMFNRILQSKSFNHIKKKTANFSPNAFSMEIKEL
jgi:hypothetical protein